MSLSLLTDFLSTAPTKQEATIIGPRLVEASTKNYMSQALEQCHNNRVVIYYWILNIGVLAFLTIIVILYIYYASKKKLTPEEARRKLLQENELIMNQIRLYRDEQKRIDSLTGLPVMGKDIKRGQEETQMRPVVFF